MVDIAEQEFKPLCWMVMNYDCNSNKITYYNVLKYREDIIKKAKKNYKNMDEFAEFLRVEIMYQFWSRAEYELIIKRTDDNRIILSPWCGCRNPEEVEIDVTERIDFDWCGFAEKHIKNKGYDNEAKIDIFYQLQYRWDDFVNYCWNYKFKYERKRKGE